jgi:uncharacterized membrane protein YeaQ/YmgE (transglycosylase-associated protein family)
MNILLWILFGALAGWITSVIAKTNYEQGTLGDIVLGIVGAFVGGLVFNMLGEAGVTGFNIYSLMVAVIGSLLVIGLGRLVRS